MLSTRNRLFYFILMLQFINNQNQVRIVNENSIVKQNPVRGYFHYCQSQVTIILKEFFFKTQSRCSREPFANPGRGITKELF